MKHNHIYLLIALASAAFSSCVKEVLPVENNPQASAPESVSVFYVSKEDEDTKTSITSLASNQFEANDKILVFNSNGTKSYEFTTDDGTVFKRNADRDTEEDKSSSFYGLYPTTTTGTAFNGTALTATIPAEQSAPVESFDPAANVSVARAEKRTDGNYYMTFKNVGNLVKFHFAEDNNVTAIVITGRNGENLAGTVNINPVNGNYSNVTNGSTHLTLKPSGSNTFQAGDYYAVLLPQTYTNGLSVKMIHGEGSYHFKRGGIGNRTMLRNKIYQLYSGDISKYTEAAMLPSLYMQDASLKNATRISFHAMAQDVDWNYADAKNQLQFVGANSDVRGYLENGTLHIWTKQGMFGLPEETISTTTEGIQLFNGFSKVEIIDNLNYIDVSFLKSFYQMFFQCNALRSIDISTWDTSSAITMKSMFQTKVDSALEYIILGDTFSLCAVGGLSHNMFASADGDRGSKIKIYAPSDIKGQFDKYYTYDKQVNWVSDNFGEFRNPTIVATSKGKTVNFTFTLGGNISDAMLNTIKVGFDGYTPKDLTLFESIGKDNIDGIEYDMYNVHLNSEQKQNKRVITQVIAQSAAKKPTNVILKGTNFTEVTFQSVINDQDFKGYVDYDKTALHPNMISELAVNNWKDYSESNWPIAGQSCKVTFYLKVENATTVNAVYLSNGSDAPFECRAAGSGALDGYTAYTMNASAIISNKSELANLKVLVQVDDQRQLHEAGTVPVQVWDIVLDAGITEASKFNVLTDRVYVIKSNTSNRFLYTDGNTATSSVKTKSADFPDNYCFWKFNPGSSPVNLLTYNTTTQRYLTSGFQASDRSGNAASWTVSDGLKFANGTSGGKTKYMRETTVSNTNPTSLSLVTTSGQNEWTVYPVTFTAPTTVAP